MTVFFAKEDPDTAAVIEYFGRIHAQNVHWQFHSLRKEMLFRRSIGRNHAALATSADWIWFADADMCFRNGCLDSLATQAPSIDAELIFPRLIKISRDHATGDAALDRVSDSPCLLDINPMDFVDHAYRQAVGGVQIVRGDTARRLGYCRDFAIFQFPLPRIGDSRDDVAFRCSLGTEGQPINLLELYRLRHDRHGPKDEFGNIQPNRRLR